MNNKEKTEKLLDSIYDNKWLLLRYFAVALVAGALRYVCSALFAPIFGDYSGTAAYFVWALLFYPAVKLIAFRNRTSDIYRLMIQMMVYVFCITALWFTRQLCVGLFYMVFAKNAALAMSLGGAVNEVICLVLMFRVVFRKK